MAYETKALLSSLAESIARTETVREAYSVIVNTANVEGVQLPTYEETVKNIENLRKGS